MADDDVNESAGEIEAEGDAAATKGKKGIVIIGAVVLLAIIGAGVAFSGILGGGDDAEEETVAESVEKSVKPAEPVFYELPEFLVNLSSSTGRVSFLKMSVTLELRDKESVKKLEAFKPKVMDTFNTYLRELRPTDLSGSAGIYRLREELMVRLNKTLSDDLVQDILFSEILVQ